ncbi:MAG: YjbQ family protein [Desulfosporosinus sp.]|nr:YjbQ family protein [Desulfosporosinus sp.]
MIHEIHLKTKRRDEMIDITAQAEALLENVQEMLVVVYSPDTTAGITINENADPNEKKDTMRILDDFPQI